MEIVLILAGGAALVLACVVLALSSARTRRPPLRTRREEELAGDDEEALIASLRPLPASPIARDSGILDLEPIEPGGARQVRGGAPDDGRAEDTVDDEADDWPNDDSWPNDDAWPNDGRSEHRARRREAR